MIDKINDIRKALEVKAYLSALSLALTLPDICGKLECPDEQKVGVRYSKWFDNYVSNWFNPPNEDRFPQFTGELCYKLRCAFLHAGNTEIPIDHFDLCIEGCGVWGSTWNNESGREYHIIVNV